MILSNSDRMFTVLVNSTIMEFYLENLFPVLRVEVLVEKDEQTDGFVFENDFGGVHTRGHVLYGVLLLDLEREI